MARTEQAAQRPLQERRGQVGRVPSANAARADAAGLVERVVARTHRVALSELRAPGRPTARVVGARHTAMYLQRVVLELTCEEIARRFDHHRTSVAHACRRIEDRRDDAGFDRRIQSLEERILQRLVEVA